MRCLLALLLLDCLTCTAGAQSLATNRLVGLHDVPLSIANTSQIGQPLRLFTGPGGTTLGLEVSSVGDVTIPLRLGVGSGVGAASWERMRIGAIAPAGGIGLSIDLVGTDSSTGIRLQRLGASGSDHAGLSITSASNGLGTGIRIGGPSGSGRPTVGTGLDIHGGTGLRYNAINDGSATAIVIGATTPPRRGIEVTTSGTDHVGGMFRSNMLGTGLVGLSISGSYTDPVHAPRVGVRGVAATNSAVAADVMTGVLGQAMRGGLGGTNTTTIGMDAMAESIGANHSGLAIGLRAQARTGSDGSSAAIAVLADIDTSRGLAIAARSGDTYLGSDVYDMPSVETFSNGLRTNRSVTRMFDGRISGTLGLIGQGAFVFMRPYALGRVVMEWPARPAAPGSVLTVASTRADTVRLAWRGGGTGMYVVAMPFNIPITVNTDDQSIVRIMADPGGSVLAGLTPGTHGAQVTLMVVQGIVGVANEAFGAAEADRIMTPTLGLVMIIAPGYATFWYDGQDRRWRLTQVTE
jgi:hypothetical protein